MYERTASPKLSPKENKRLNTSGCRATPYSKYWTQLQQFKDDQAKRRYLLEDMRAMDFYDVDTLKSLLRGVKTSETRRGIVRPSSQRRRSSGKSRSSSPAARRRKSKKSPSPSPAARRRKSSKARSPSPVARRRKSSKSRAPSPVARRKSSKARSPSPAARRKSSKSRVSSPAARRKSPRLAGRGRTQWEALGPAMGPRF